MDFIVGPSQPAFIEGRNTLDNVIVAHELIKGYNNKGVSPRCIIKVDIRKAYDSVEWPFLKMVLLEFGIPYKLVELIMRCVSTVNYSLLLNGGLTPSFQAKKGLRADSHYIQMMLQCFEHFSEISRLKANMEKSCLYIARVTPDFISDLIDKFHFTVGEIPFKYLGVPLSSRKLIIGQCMPLVEKIAARVKKALVSWETLCKPKSAGGLNILDFYTWNKAAISKLLWAVAMKKDKFWVLWIHSYYIKGKRMEDMVIPKQSSWIVRKILAARGWFSTVIESQEHLFFDRGYSQHICAALLQWVGLNRRIGHWHNEVEWLEKKVRSKRPWNATLVFLFAATVYQV
ncbi:uncharacterized protein LOC132624469 [Lycium barbarum]|uniref:uncharacterized protein LOC132624469 n=1 Tax=Lycium barbarum TaxID=112863 RepID=UPI00293E3C4F|nr:uncharacterized protein LOC132624469 [Lycium barbarum]